MADKMRVHILAKELNVPSKTIIDKCRAEGIDTVKNHMSTLSAGLTATIMEWFSTESSGAALETAEPVDLDKVRIRRKPAAKEKEKEEAPAEAVAVSDEVEGEFEAPATVVAEMPVEAEPASEVVEEATPPAPPEPPVVEEPEPAVTEEPAVEGEPAEAPEFPRVAAEAPQDAEAGPVETEAPEEAAKPREPFKPAGPQHVPTPAKLQGPRVVRYEAPDRDALTLRRGPRPRPAAGEPEAPGPRAPLRVGEGEANKDEKAQRRRARLNPRRAAGRMAEAGERLAEWRDQDLAERQERLETATGRRIVRRRTTQPGRGSKPTSSGPITRATVNEPVRLKEFCSATGLSFMQLVRVMKDEFQLMPNINMVLPNDTAQLLALHFGIELEVVPAKTLLDGVREEFANRPRDNNQPRPPVVTILGHVDHGKTSLLDRIRKAHVVASEDGGITQHLGAYHIQAGHIAVTFLDTPGHEAFTEMRARGAQVTDVVVLVVAADDGLMPQTIEAINHAKAAEVPIVVALNKIDLGEQNVLKIYGQLTEHGLTPSGDWGGEVDVIQTSATTGQGITELVEHLGALTGILDLKGDPTVPATGTVLEAETKLGVGAVARVLVTEGTLRVGDVVVCGGAFGKIRAMLDDRGQRIDAAGPSIPVEVWGLDDVPSAGDALFQLDSLQQAKDVATETKQRQQIDARQGMSKGRSLADLLQRRSAEDIPELPLIIKADVDGSLAALKQVLGNLPSDEVKLTFQHVGVGAVNDSDVLLAATTGGIVVAFRVEATTGAKRLAELHGVDVRSYRVIYDVHDDIKKALEGLLAPDESVESRGRAEVRDLFKLSKRTGVVAGCFVTDGVIERRHLAKIIRDGVIVREGAQMGSLRRFKDDVREVRAGMECGIKIDGFDDVHVGDVIETYEIVKTARTL
ncbi:MAG: translation initiation factor IF-2 [Phycisphaerae bacterium]|nr:translation initiation factor IF-2 [Phycisphaerae bacterium]